MEFEVLNETGLVMEIVTEGVVPEAFIFWPSVGTVKAESLWNENFLHQNRNEFFHLNKELYASFLH